MSYVTILLLSSLLTCMVQALPPPIPTYTVDFFLVKKALQFAILNNIAYKEATTSILDTLPNPPTDAENEIRWILENMRDTAFFAYNKLLFLANSQLLTLAYATQTAVWYDKAFYHLAGNVETLIATFDEPINLELQSLLDQIVNQTRLSHFVIGILLTTA